MLTQDEHNTLEQLINVWFEGWVDFQQSEEYPPQVADDYYTQEEVDDWDLGVYDHPLLDKICDMDWELVMLPWGRIQLVMQ
jgi:hypothetical protein